MVTIKDVAAAAGVSVSTASRALNDKGTISPKVRAQIKKVAKELNYHPNEMARSLQTQRTHMIGLVAHQADSLFYGRLIQSIERRCFENGYKLLLCTTGGSAIRENTFAQMFDANKLDGAILAGSVDYDSDFAAKKLPVVTIERHLSDEIPMVTCDNIGGGRLAARTLWERGCKCAAVFVNVAATIANERYQSFAEECERIGMRCMIETTELLEGEYLPCFRELFAKHPDLDGFFCIDDVAMVCREACRELDVRVPDEVQILGFDGMDIAKRFHISTIVQPIEEMGALAVDLLMRQIEGELAASRSILPVRLVERETTRKL